MDNIIREDADHPTRFGLVIEPTATVTADWPDIPYNQWFLFYDSLWNEEILAFKNPDDTLVVFRPIASGPEIYGRVRKFLNYRPVRSVSMRVSLDRSLGRKNSVDGNCKSPEN